jgi:hypothetical protein
MTSVNNLSVIDQIIARLRHICSPGIRVTLSRDIANTLSKEKEQLFEQLLSLTCKNGYRDGLRHRVFHRLIQCKEDAPILSALRSHLRDLLGALQDEIVSEIREYGDPQKELVEKKNAILGSDVWCATLAPFVVIDREATRASIATSCVIPRSELVPKERLRYW